MTTILPDFGDDPDDDFGPEDDWEQPCPICGSVNQCGQDEAGFPWIHTYTDADFDREPRRAVDDVQTGGRL